MFTRNPRSKVSSGARARFVPRRLIVVSHRLPIEVQGGVAKMTVRRTVGGLASAVDAVLKSAAASRLEAPPVWIGWPGAPPDTDATTAVADAITQLGGMVAVPILASTHSLFYEDFAKRTLWPLCHSFPSYVRVDQAAWEAYRDVNSAYFEVVAPLVEPGDLLWVHDFHLMLLPRMLRKRFPDAAIAYFHHIPFPTLDVLRVVPDMWIREIVLGLLGADVVGFHTYDDVRHALRVVQQFLDVEAQSAAVTIDGRVTRFDAFPIGVDFHRWNAAKDETDVRNESLKIEGALAGRKLVLSVDRLDYTKGILNRILAFERLLVRRADLRGGVTLLLEVAPSRGGVESYWVMRSQIEAAVTRINGQHGDATWTPIVYRHRALGRAALAAYYLRADVALVTPLRDGMNLVAKEFLATRRDESAALVLSETAGAARELGEAILVNPFDIDGISEALELALDMPEEERRRRCRQMRDRLERYDIERWGQEQFDCVARTRGRTSALRARRLPSAQRARLVQAARQAPSRLFLLDYDGTLVPFARDPSLALPDEALIDLLRRVGASANTQVVLLSGRDATTLQAWFDGLPVALVAEHGARLRRFDGSWSLAPGLNRSVRSRVSEVMQVFADRLPGAIVESKDLSLAWHWRAADPEIGDARARYLIAALGAIGLAPDAQILAGNKVIEVRGVNATKGTAARVWVDANPGSLILAAGDDSTDEDLFAVLPEGAWSLRVGPGNSLAQYYLESPQALRALLEEIASTGSR